MDLDELVKRLDWLEKEHRKDRAAIADLQEKLASYEGGVVRLQNQIKDLSGDISRLAPIAARLDQFDTMLTQYRSESSKAVDEIEKRRLKHEREVDDRRRVELENINKSILEIRNSLDAFNELRRGLQARAEEDSRLARLITELEKKIKDFNLVDDELRRGIRIADEARKQDAKRITDIQGDLAAIRKRADEARERADLNADTIRQLDARVNELMASETDRRIAQMQFIEQQNLAQVDRDRAWKEIQLRFENFARQTATLDQQLLTLDETQRSVKRSQEAFEDMNTRLERRINEITEMQRLAEDRFRQEWVTFKADDQKRWTNYTLTQDELNKDLNVEIDKLNQRLAAIDDATQSMQDLLQQTTEATETQLQELMNWAHEFLTNYERIMGRARPTR
jgi:chromosome segregation ATPase